MKNSIQTNDVRTTEKILDIMTILSALLERDSALPELPIQTDEHPPQQSSPTRLPKLLGRLTPPKLETLVPQQLPADAFTKAEFMRRWKAGRPRSYYLMGSPGAQAVASRLGLPLYKGGSVSPGRLKKREQELTQDKYASMSTGSHVVEDGFSWSAEPLDTTISFLSGSPVKVNARDIRFIMPEGMTKDWFEDEIGAVLAPLSLAVWSKSPSGQAFLAQRNIDPATCLRLSPKQYGDSISPTQVQELYIIRPRSNDVQALGRMIECIIYNYVMKQR